MLTLLLHAQEEQNLGEQGKGNHAEISEENEKFAQYEKEGKNLYYINARSDIRAAVCHSLDLYGFIITFNC